MYKFLLLLLLPFSLCLGKSFHVEISDVLKIANVQFVEDVPYVLLYDNWEKEYQGYVVYQQNAWAYPILYPTLLARYGEKLDFITATSLFGELDETTYGFNH